MCSSRPLAVLLAFAAAWAPAARAAAPQDAPQDAPHGAPPRAATLGPAVRTGIDVVAASGCDALKGRKVGLITNHTGRTSDGRRTVDVLAALPGVELVALFSPEHGWEGKVDRHVDGDTIDAATGLKVQSLYGEKLRKPTPAMLQGLDTLVFDVQDAGCRFYTYVSTMGLALEAAAERKLRFVVLDRPNPIGGTELEGPVLDASRTDFVGFHTIPLRHGLTAGELARMLVGEKGLGADLHVVACEGWRRDQTFERTGLPWVNPSPNLRSALQALLYPGIGMLEGTNLSVGRGTDTPFQILGAPWCDGVKLAARLRAAELPGCGFVPVRFTPRASKHEGKECGGIEVAVTDWRAFRPVLTGMHVACALRDLFPDWDHRRLDWLMKDAATYERFAAGAQAPDLVAPWRKGLDVFRMRRRPFLLYE